MDYEKKYKEALEDIRVIYPNLKGDAKLAVEHAFPELYEGDDNWYIEELKDFLDTYGEDYFGRGEWQRFVDWLEKQKVEHPKEQNQNIELIQKSWYMEGYHDCEFGYEPRWIIKTGEGGPQYEENPKYGQHIEKQDYSGLTELEQAIHRGFLCAGVVNVPVNIIKETAQDCLAHLPADWSGALCAEIIRK